jgi:hypothetical protein
MPNESILSTFHRSSRKLSYIGVDSWMNFIHEMYGHPIHRFAVIDGGRPLGALSLAKSSIPFSVTTLPPPPSAVTADLPTRTMTARDLLLDEARRLAKT